MVVYGIEVLIELKLSEQLIAEIVELKCRAVVLACGCEK